MKKNALLVYLVVSKILGKKKRVQRYSNKTWRVELLFNIRIFGAAIEKADYDSGFAVVFGKINEKIEYIKLSNACFANSMKLISGVLAPHHLLFREK